MDSQGNLQFTVKDRIGGQPLTAWNAGLSLLREFLSEIETFIKGDDTRATLANATASVESGSLKVVVTLPQPQLENVRSDLEHLQQTGDLDAIQVRRAQVIEKWQARSRRNPDRSYTMSAPAGPTVRVLGESHFTHSGHGTWVPVEKYLTGTVMDLGGKKSPTVLLVPLDSKESIVIASTAEQLASEPDNHLYKTVTLRVSAEQHLVTGKLRNLRLIEFLALPPVVDEAALASLWEKGQQAWSEVSSGALWVEHLRGNV